MMSDVGCKAVVVSFPFLATEECIVDLSYIFPLYVHIFALSLLTPERYFVLINIYSSYWVVFPKISLPGLIRNHHF